MAEYAITVLFKGIVLSEQKSSTSNVISSLVTKAIEKKEQRKLDLELSRRPDFKKILFSQFDILDIITKPERDTVIYHLAKKDDPSKQLCCKTVSNANNKASTSLIVNEASKIEICQHPNIVSFIKTGSEFNTPYFMCEWIDGETLSSKIERYKEKGFRHDHIAWLVYQLAGALEYMHLNGVCHLDVKPSNIIISQDDSLKLIDFGAAQYIGEKNTVIEASLGYASPDYVKHGDGTPQDDVFSLAVMTYHLFVGTTSNASFIKDFKGSKRPKCIPKHVWSLITKVIFQPRNHGFSPITFAQTLGQIDIKHEWGGVPIFKNLRNADLVLAQTRSVKSEMVNSWKYLELTLVSAVVLFVVLLLDRNFDMLGPSAEDTSVQTQSAILEKASHFSSVLFSADPWSADKKITNLHNLPLVEASPDSQEDIKAIEHFYALKNKSEENRYKKHEKWVTERQKYNQTEHANLTKIKGNVSNLNEYLDESGVNIDQITKEIMLSLMFNVGKSIESMESYSLGYELKPSELALSIEQGKGELVQKYLRNAWERSQAESFYYSHVLANEITLASMKRADELAEGDLYTRAIKLIENTKTTFGSNDQLDLKQDELLIARSKYIIYTALDGEYSYNPNVIKNAFNDIKKISPEKEIKIRKDVSEKVIKKLSQGYINNKLDGVMSINKALNITEV